MSVTFRTAVRDDANTLGDLMFTAIRTGSSPYTEAQRAAWSPSPNHGDEWAARLDAQYVVVADGPAGPVGFMTLTPRGYIDLAFILPEARGRGIFGQMLRRIEDHARQNGLRTLVTHASLMAEPAFARHGFGLVRREAVQRDGDALHRAEMSKQLEKT